MKRNIIIAVLMVLLSNWGFANPDDKTKINILLKEQSNVTELMRTASVFPNKAARRDFVVNTLKQLTEASQQELMTMLNEMEQNGLVSEIRPLWIVNSISCYAETTVISELAKRNDVLTVYQCEEFRLEFEEDEQPSKSDEKREIAENLLKVNADQVWEQGYTGQGVVVAVIDGGINYAQASNRRVNHYTTTTVPLKYRNEL